MRLFISVDMPDEIMQAAQQIQYYFKEVNLFNGTYTKPENLHCTLKFLGEVDAAKIEELCSRLQTIEFPSQSASTDGLGLFSSNHPHILYLTIVCPALIELVLAFDFLLPEFTQEHREFINHVTLARIKSVSDKERLEQEVENFQVQKIDFRIQEFVLKKSGLSSDGAIYSDVMRFTLK